MSSSHSFCAISSQRESQVKRKLKNSLFMRLPLTVNPCRKELNQICFRLVCLFVVLCLPVLSHAQSSPKPNASTPRGSVSGRVTIKGKPAPGIFVGLRKTAAGVGPEQFLKAITDHEGFYRITNVPPGSYDIQPSALAYVVSDANNTRSKNVIVAEDENVEDINFSLVRGGVITGKVIDADGRPVIQQQVHLYRIEAVQQQARQVFSGARVQTDDRGIYRFFGLNAGRYKVASGRGEDNYAGGYTANRNVYKQVFHPDQTDQEKATVIDVREGSESTDVDIKLGRAMQTFSISGRVINEDGTPAPNVRFGLMRTFGQTYETVDGVLSDSKGDFTVDAIAPGKYGVLTYTQENQALKAEPPTFDVIDQDVSGITVRFTKGLSVAGVVVLEHEDKKAWAKLLELKLRGYVSAPPGATLISQSNSVASISPDGSFQLPGLSPGVLNFWLGGAGNNAPKGFMISRIEHNGVAAPNGIEIKDGEQVTGVRVIVSYGTATLRGVVNVDAGLVPEGARTLARLMRPGMQNSSVSAALVDARGHFLMEGIPPGVYELVVWQTVPGARTRPPSAKQQVTIQDGVVNEVSVTLELPPPRP